MALACARCVAGTHWRRHGCRSPAPAYRIQTWEAEGGVWGTNMALAFGGLRPPVDEQLARAKTFTGKNVVYLRRKNLPINKASLYAAHFLGAVTAAKVIGADPASSAEALAGLAATAANPAILRGKTVGQFLTWLHGKTGEWAR